MNIFEALREDKKTCKLITKAYKNYAWKLWSGEKGVYRVIREHEDKLNSASTFNSFVDSLIDYDFSYNCDSRNIEWYNDIIASVFRKSGIGYWRRYTNCFPEWNEYRWETIYEDFQEKFNNRIYKNLKNVFGLKYKNYKHEVAAWMFSYMISEYYMGWKFIEFPEVISSYKFNADGFNFQRNFDLAWKIANNTLSIADKAEAIFIFNDIIERLIKRSKYDLTSLERERLMDDDI